jgi:hypothetical protein
MLILFIFVLVPRSQGLDKTSNYARSKYKINTHSVNIQHKISRQSYVSFVYAFNYNNQTEIITTFVFRLMNITINITN